jgi:hypothetical protein
MIKIFAICLILATLSVNAQQRRNPLAGTRWQFVGLHLTTSDSLVSCRKDIIYTIDFKPKNKLEGLATVRHTGRYKVKKDNYVKIKTFISKATPPGTTNSTEFECRLNYSKYLLKGGKFDLRNDKLEIISNPYVTMVFKSLK